MLRPTCSPPLASLKGSNQLQMAELNARLEALAESGKPAATLIEGYRAVLFTPGGSDADTVKAKESALKYVGSPRARRGCWGTRTLRVLHRITSRCRTRYHPRDCHAAPAPCAKSQGVAPSAVTS